MAAFHSIKRQGPGAASAYLHLGLAGPRVVDFGANGDDGAAARLVDNPESWLRFTDLVFIDPVGTGWSRAAGDGNEFYGIRQDAEAMAKVISLYVQRSGRLDAPKYLLGESYGGFRAAKVARALKDSQGMLVSGVIMVSPMIEARLIFRDSDDPLGAALQFPSIVAARLEREKAFDVKSVAEAETFAMGDYLVSLAGPAPDGPEGAAFYDKVARLTGIDRRLVERARGFLGDILSKTPDGEIASPIILDETGVPGDAGPGFAEHAQQVRARLALVDWAAVDDGEQAFSASPDALIRWAPVLDELKQLDEAIVRNSVRFRWQEVRRDLRACLDASAVLGDAA